MDSALLHEVDYLVLVGDSMIDEVVELNLHLVLQLTSFVQEVLILWHGEVLASFSQEIELSDMSPGVVPVAHRVHSPDSHVLTTSEQVHLVDLSVEALPVEGKRHPGKAIRRVEDGQSHLPLPEEWVHEEQIPT